MLIKMKLNEKSKTNFEVEQFPRVWQKIKYFFSFPEIQHIRMRSKVKTIQHSCFGILKIYFTYKKIDFDEFDVIYQ